MVKGDITKKYFPEEAEIIRLIKEECEKVKENIGVSLHTKIQPKEGPDSRGNVKFVTNWDMMPGIARLINAKFVEN